MLIELTETSKNNWTWIDSSGNHWSILLGDGSTPIPAPMSDKTKLKAVLKLKEAGFDAEDILVLLEKL